MASKSHRPAPGVGHPPDIQPPQPPESLEEPPLQTPTQAQGPVGPSQGEFDELREDNLNLAAENAQLRSNLEQMMQRLERLERVRSGKPAYTPDPEGLDRDTSGEVPLFDEDADFATIWGDPQVQYMQNGHYFDPAKRFVRSEKTQFLGSPRPFRLALVGHVRPPRIREAA